MRLRARVTLAALLATAPALLSLGMYDRASKHAAAAARLEGFTRHQLRSPERCLREGDHAPPRGPHAPPHGPPDGPPHARPARLWAYDERGVPARPGSPPLPASLRDAALTRGVAVEPLRWRSDEVRLVMRTPWGAGACALVLADGSTSAAWGAVLPPGWL